MSIGMGMLAGFIATAVLSALMLMKSAMGIMPELDIARMLGEMMGGGPALGWIGHFFIGTVLWGTAFAFLAPYLPGDNQWVKGVSFGMVAWLLMMIMIMPMAGGGVFGLRFGLMAPIMTAMLHAIFGAVLGGSYGALASRSEGGVGSRSQP